jgi:hypothetical protein
MPIKNYTTEVAEERTVGEIMGLLAAKGARTIQVIYDDRGRPSGVSFMLLLQEMPVPFRLPCNFEGVFRAIASGYKDRLARSRYERNPASHEQARRVAWRIVKDWVAAQMALVEAEQAALAQVFLPYCVMNSDGMDKAITMYDKFLDQVTTQKRLVVVSE